jgi:hypothetical protein
LHSKKTPKNLVADFEQPKSVQKIPKSPKKQESETFPTKPLTFNPKTQGEETLPPINDVNNDQVSQTAYSKCAFGGIDESRDNSSFSSKKIVCEDLEQQPDAHAEEVLGTGENAINTSNSNPQNKAPELNSEYEETPILVGSKGNPLDVSGNESDKKNSLRQKT